ncbi:MAG: hypothetical protein RJQ04_18710 [Longimicrobiales bacterium]
MYKPIEESRHGSTGRPVATTPRASRRIRPAEHARRGWALVVAAALFCGCEAVFSPAVPAVSAGNCDADFTITSDGPDAGFTYSFVLTNVGDAGVINVMPGISTSEGEWMRDQTLHFEAGESRRLSYFFAEPSIHAQNAECFVRTIPAPQ